MLKKFIIRWALKQLKKIIAIPDISYEELEEYGVEDIYEIPETKEKALLI